MAPTTSTSRTQPKILRILRLRVTDKPGFLGKVATLLGDLEANIGEIHIHSQGPDFIIRDISLQLDDEKHLQRVQDAVSSLEGVEVEMIIDPVQQVHQGGKIEMRSRIELTSLAELRRIYTPGVAQICKLIAKDKNYSKEYTSISHCCCRYEWHRHSWARKHRSRCRHACYGRESCALLPTCRHQRRAYLD
jgi:malate dehydrogenase (oxaloacetate-decarboxylating)